MKRILFVLFVLLLPVEAYAAACISNGTGGGNWSDEATWTDASCGAAHFPVSGDTAQIVAGDVVTVDGNITVGTAPANNTTYNIDISGTLYWPNTPGADWTFTARSSIRINAGGILQVADSATPLNSANRAYFLFENTAPVPDQKYKIYVNGGKFYVYGNSAYTSNVAVTRARILACIPDCNAGAGRTIMLDRAVEWAASASATHDAIVIGIGGNESTSPAAGDDGEVITSWGALGSSSINGVALTEDHMIGDILYNASRNVLFESDSQIYHSIVDTTATNDPYDLNWVRFNEFGDSTLSNNSAICFNATNNTVGSINYVALTNSEDGAQTTGFYILSSGWTSFKGNLSHDNRSSGNGYYFSGASYPADEYVVKDCTYIDGSNGNATGASFSACTVKTDVDGMWVSNAYTGINEVSSSVTKIRNGLFHAPTNYALNLTSASGTYYKSIHQEISNNEFRNHMSASGILVYVSGGGSYTFKNNDYDGAATSCIQIKADISAYFSGNTYDRCNTWNTSGRAGFEYANTTSSYLYAVNESFGTSAANNKSNVTIVVPDYNAAGDHITRYVCNDCTFAATNNPITCSVMPTDGIILGTCAAYTNVVYVSDGAFFTLHNKDKVAGTHVGWGPGAMVISRETGTVVDNTLNVKVVPGNPTEYGYLPLGSVNVVAGQTLTVNVQLRKNEAQSAGYRPRLALEGSGFDRVTNYDEMSDAVDTWETTTVTGVATYSGTVHIFLGIKNNLSGANNYAPVWPPTIEIFADGISITKVGP